MTGSLLVILAVSTLSLSEAPLSCPACGLSGAGGEPVLAQALPDPGRRERVQAELRLVEEHLRELSQSRSWRGVALMAIGVPLIPLSIIGGLFLTIVGAWAAYEGGLNALLVGAMGCGVVLLVSIYLVVAGALQQASATRERREERSFLRQQRDALRLELEELSRQPTRTRAPGVTVPVMALRF